MNRLADETSPYLRQHADNPVEWYPWGPEALARAQQEDKPIFLSIGYASCHWCHVMAHESFEDPATAADLARSYVSVKVDREERPDLDAVYMAAVQTLTGSGGWPMTVFCLPDGRPFFGGTYFPPDDRHGTPAFRRVLAALADAWATRRDEVTRQAEAVTEAVSREVRLTDHLVAAPGGALPGAGPALDAAVGELAAGFDPEWGGFGPAPKFPRPAQIELCLWHHLRIGDPRSATMATTTLDAMAAGGLYDHLAGGFCRYSTDATWTVPHFEKMLTDQALLARAYLRAWQVTGRPHYRQVATETLDYVLDRLGAPGGALFSSEDADAGGVEGSHATFTPGQLRQALEAGGRADVAEEAARWYGIAEPGNFEGASIPRRPLGAPLARPEAVEVARRLLLEARLARPQPALDDKVLTEWNAMAAATLAEAAAVTGNGRWASAAADIVTFLFDQLRQPGTGRWLRSWQGGRARHLALAADLAWVAEACARLAELTGTARWLAQGTEVAHQLLDRFADPGEDGGGGGAAGGLFTTAHDAEALVVRPKDLVDGAVPSANSVAACALLRLGALADDDRLVAAGADLAAVAAPLLDRHPSAVADLVPALGLVAGRATEVVVAGDRPDLVAAYRARWRPGSVLAWGERAPGPLWEGRRDGLAYVCRDRACRTPAATVEEMEAQLAAAAAEAE